VHIDCECNSAKKSLTKLQEIISESGGVGFDVEQNQLMTDLKFGDKDQFVICAVMAYNILREIMYLHSDFLSYVTKEQLPIADQIADLAKEISTLKEKHEPTGVKHNELAEKQLKILSTANIDSFKAWFKKLFISLIPLVAAAKDAEEYIDAMTAQLPGEGESQQLLNLCNGFIEYCRENGLLNTIRNYVRNKTYDEADLAGARIAFTNLPKLTKAVNDLVLQIKEAVSERDEFAKKGKALDDELKELSKNNGDTYKVQQDPNNGGRIHMERMLTGANVPNDRLGITRAISVIHESADEED
jgi:hypothetical protein